MRLFEAARLRDFEQRMLKILLPKVDRDESWLRNQVHLGVQAARHFGLEAEPDVATFIEATCQHIPGGLNEADPRKLPVQALAILTTYGTESATKAERYRNWASSWDGEEVGR
ncbi:MAG: hypothetical protein JWO80_1295 [Bryobacterales bacterium]|jgi:hypothetical protein|nr:hypothetical protein [Bryobacterales bacterium]